MLLKCLYSFTECTDAADNGPAVTESIEDKGSSPTATAETASTAAEGEEDNVSSDIPKTAHRPPEKEIIPELPDATANAFTQLVRGKLALFVVIFLYFYAGCYRFVQVFPGARPYNCKHPSSWQLYQI